MPDSFDLPAVNAALANSIFFNKIHHFSTTPSTNTLALEAAQSGAPNCSVWLADEQTAGRGRSNNVWHSSPGDGLYLSVLLRPQMALTEALWLSLATGLATKAAIASVTHLQPDIRWPNDILINDKKCGGILVETSAAASRPDTPAMLRYAIVGVGLNLNHQSFPPDLEAFATSLRRETGKSFSRDAVLIEFLRALENQLALLEAELRSNSANPRLLDRFAAASSWVCGKPVSVDEAGGYTGVTDGLDARGFLRVAGDDGVLHIVLSGGVRSR